jgi:valyl-tRNA synthetase
LIKPVLARASEQNAAHNTGLAEPVEALPSSSAASQDEKGGLRQAQASRDGDSGARESRAVAGWALDQILVMLHPFMPFITEELWHAQGERPYELIVAKWPQPQAKVDKAAKAEVDWLIELTSNLRAAKNELGIAPGAKLEAFIANPSDRARQGIANNTASLERLARLSAIHFEAAPEGAALQVSAGGDLFVIPLEGVIDIAAEKARLSKALEASAKEAKSLESRLANPAFVEKAKPQAVDKARADHAHHAAEVARLEAALARLG